MERITPVGRSRCFRREYAFSSCSGLRRSQVCSSDLMSSLGQGLFPIAILSIRVFQTGILLWGVGWDAAPGRYELHYEN